jgi:hypothetical protein
MTENLTHCKPLSSHHHAHSVAEQQIAACARQHARCPTTPCVQQQKKKYAPPHLSSMCAASRAHIRRNQCFTVSMRVKHFCSVCTLEIHRKIWQHTGSRLLSRWRVRGITLTPVHNTLRHQATKKVQIQQLDVFNLTPIEPQQHVGHPADQERPQ